jgi:hypothetical protein
MKNGFQILGSLLFLFSCANRDVSKTAEYLHQENFYTSGKKISINKPGNRIQIADTGKLNILKYYEVTFTEHYTVKNNLLEVTESNELEAKNQIPYIDLKGYFQKLFLIKVDVNDSGKNPYFIYYSIKYNSSSQPIAMGKTYLGQRDNIYYNDNKCMYRIVFKEEMIFKNGKEKKFTERYKLKPVAAPMIFYADSADFTDEYILVNTIILHGANKIGGTKHLVYPIAETLGSKEALKFINQPKK